jgi:hypothetical protein
MALSVGGPMLIGIAQLLTKLPELGAAWLSIKGVFVTVGTYISGSFFAAIAVGVGLGLASVWVILETGFLDYMSKLGALFGALAPQWARDVLLIITSPLVSLGAGIIAIVSGNFDQIGTNMVKPFQWAADAIGRLMDGLAEAIKSPLNVLIDGLNAIIQGINTVSSVGGLLGDTFDLPTIPHLANGGIVTQPTVALIGEAGPEAVVPLSGSGAGSMGADIHDNTFIIREEADIGKVAKQLYTLIEQGKLNRGISG